MTEHPSADATASGDAPHHHYPQIAQQPDLLQLQAELLAIQENLDTLAHLMRHCQPPNAILNGIAGLLDSMSSQVADVSLQLAA